MRSLLRASALTAWRPDESPMFGLHRPIGQWTLMLDESVFVQFLYEPGDFHRTGGVSNDQFSSANWLMAMARRPVGKGRIELRGMVSLEP